MGHVPLPPHEDGEPLLSTWPVHVLGKKGEARVDAEAYVRASHLAAPNQIAYGSISVQFHPNAINRHRNEVLPLLPKAGPRGGGGGDEEEEEPGRDMPERFARYRRLTVKLGKFGLHEDFSFTDFNQTTVLATLDNTVPNSYCNPLLLVLYLLPWTSAAPPRTLQPRTLQSRLAPGWLAAPHAPPRGRGWCCVGAGVRTASARSRSRSSCSRTSWASCST